MSIITWNKLRKYLRQHKMGDVIVRQNIIDYYSKTHKRNTNKELKHINEDNWYITLEPCRGAMDKNLDILIKCGCISEIKFGVFTLMRQISKSAKIGDLKKLASSDWKGWFVNNNLFDD